MKFEEALAEMGNNNVVKRHDQESVFLICKLINLKKQMDGIIYQPLTDEDIKASDWELAMRSID